MFNNWITINEIIYLLRKIRREPRVISTMMSRIPLNRTGKVKATWAHTDNPPTHWYDVPAVRERWNRFISGDSRVDSIGHMSRKYWADKDSLRALSLGCGEGSRVLRWAETKKFLSIDACDISESRIAHAIQAARLKRLDNIVRFRTADALTIDARANSYDVILCEGSLHHFSPLEAILRKINTMLTPDGLFIVDDFAGPSRFQWTQRQLEIVNALLALFPDRYKMLWNSRYTKPAVIRPSRLRMIVQDPSEAVESSFIVPLLNSIFNPVEMKGYGGAILHLLLGDIAHHFVSPDAEGVRLLEICCAIEDLLMTSGEIRHDFIFCICKKRI